MNKKKYCAWRQLLSSLSSAQKALLIRLYHQQKVSTDKLPYTTEFMEIVKAFQNEYGKEYNEQFLFYALIGLRKNKKLVKKNKKQLVKKVDASKKVTVSACINCGSLNGKEALWQLTRLASEYVCENCT